MTSSRLIKVAVIGKPHGVRGLVHIHSQMEDGASLAEFPYLEDECGQRWQLSWYKNSQDVAALETVEGQPIADRDEASKMARKSLFVPRSFFPELHDDEFYLSDLIKMDVYEAGKLTTQVKQVRDYGAGAFIELLDGRLIPFTKRCIPTIDRAKGCLEIVPPEEVTVPQEQQSS